MLDPGWTKECDNNVLNSGIFLKMHKKICDMFFEWKPVVIGDKIVIEGCYRLYDFDKLLSDVSLKMSLLIA